MTENPFNIKKYKSSERKKKKEAKEKIFASYSLACFVAYLINNDYSFSSFGLKSLVDFWMENEERCMHTNLFSSPQKKKPS